MYIYVHFMVFIMSHLACQTTGYVVRYPNNIVLFRLYTVIEQTLLFTIRTKGDQLSELAPLQVRAVWFSVAIQNHLPWPGDEPLVAVDPCRPVYFFPHDMPLTSRVGITPSAHHVDARAEMKKSCSGAHFRMGMPEDGHL